MMSGETEQYRRFMEKGGPVRDIVFVIALTICGFFLTRSMNEHDALKSDHEALKGQHSALAARVQIESDNNKVQFAEIKDALKEISRTQVRILERVQQK